MTNWDFLIRNAMVYDGTGNEPMLGDVAIQDERIVAIGENLQEHAGQVINANGLALAPGFIDVHSHDDVAVIADPDMDFKVMQGVTTTIIGNCGEGAAPLCAHNLGFFKMMYPELKLPVWSSYEGYMSLVEQEPPSLNIAVLVGHGSVRSAVMGNAQRQPSGPELVQMLNLLEEGLNAGAVGFSSGLVYEPGCFAQTQELIHFAKQAVKAQTIYTTHMRNEANQLLDAVKEAIHIGEESGIGVQISHHKAAGQENWGLVKDSLELIYQARSRGVEITVDQYPYTTGSTILSAVVKNGALRSNAQSGFGCLQGSDVLIAYSCHHEWQGKNLAQLGQQWGINPEAAALRILEAGEAIVVLKLMAEEDVCTVMKQPITLIGSDGVPAAKGNPHPRLYGTFPRILGQYVREKKLLPLTEAIHRMTGLSATKFKLKDRGFIRENSYADLVLFSPERINDIGTYEKPRQYPTGIDKVFVNGRVVVMNNVHTHQRPGKVLRAC